MTLNRAERHALTLLYDTFDAVLLDDAERDVVMAMSAPSNSRRPIVAPVKPVSRQQLRRQNVAGQQVVAL